MDIFISIYIYIDRYVWHLLCISFGCFLFFDLVSSNKIKKWLEFQCQQYGTPREAQALDGNLDCVLRRMRTKIYMRVK